MIRRSSNHWKIWLVLFPIIGTCALANFPGGMKGFFSSWYAVSTDTARGFLQHFWNPATLNENDQIGSLNATSANFDPDSTNGWDMGTADNKYITVSGPISNGTSYTITMWAKPDLTAMQANVVGGWLISDREGGTARRDFQWLYDKSASAWAFGVYQTNNVDVYATITNRINNQWQYLSGVVSWFGSTGTVQIYWNGIIGVSGSISNTPNNSYTGNTAIGTASWSDTGFGLGQPETKYHGSIGKVRFYNRALTATEVQREYERDVTGP